MYIIIQLKLKMLKKILKQKINAYMQMNDLNCIAILFVLYKRYTISCGC